MKDNLIQLNDIDGTPIGLWYTKEKIFEDQLVDWFRDYDDSDMYNKKGIDGFEEFVKEIGYIIKRVFVEEIFL